MQDTRPRFLNLTQISFPVTAIVSICQRISGVVLLLGIPVILYYLQQSLADIQQFHVIQSALLNNYFVKVAVLLYVVALMFHVVGGIRHLIMDAGYLESKSVAVVTSWLSFVLTVLAMVPVIYWVI